MTTYQPETGALYKLGGRRVRSTDTNAAEINNHNNTNRRVTGSLHPRRRILRVRPSGPNLALVLTDDDHTNSNDSTSNSISNSQNNSNSDPNSDDDSTNTSDTTVMMNIDVNFENSFIGQIPEDALHMAISFMTRQDIFGVSLTNLEYMDPFLRQPGIAEFMPQHIDYDQNEIQFGINHPLNTRITSATIKDSMMLTTDTVRRLATLPNLQSVVCARYRQNISIAMRTLYFGLLTNTLKILMDCVSSNRSLQKQVKHYFHSQTNSARLELRQLNTDLMLVLRNNDGDPFSYARSRLGNDAASYVNRIYRFDSHNYLHYLNIRKSLYSSRYWLMFMNLSELIALQLDGANNSNDFFVFHAFSLYNRIGSENMNENGTINSLVQNCILDLPGLKYFNFTMDTQPVLNHVPLSVITMSSLNLKILILKLDTQACLSFTNLNVLFGLESFQPMINLQHLEFPLGQMFPDYDDDDQLNFDADVLQITNQLYEFVPNIETLVVYFLNIDQLLNLSQLQQLKHVVVDELPPIKLDEFLSLKVLLKTLALSIHSYSLDTISIIDRPTYATAHDVAELLNQQPHLERLKTLFVWSTNRRQFPALLPKQLWHRPIYQWFLMNQKTNNDQIAMVTELQEFDQRQVDIDDEKTNPNFNLSTDFDDFLKISNDKTSNDSVGDFFTIADLTLSRSIFMPPDDESSLFRNRYIDHNAAVKFIQDATKLHCQLLLNYWIATYAVKFDDYAYEQIADDHFKIEIETFRAHILNHLEIVTNYFENLFTFDDSELWQDQYTIVEPELTDIDPFIEDLIDDDDMELVSE